MIWQDLTDYSKPPSGEANLWIAVADRALQDFTHFYTWVLDVSMELFYGRKNKDAACQMALSMRLEKRRLETFLFCPKPKEFNLAWITQELCRQTFCMEPFRKHLDQLHFANLREHRTNKLLQPFVEQYKAELEALPTKVAPRTKLRFVSPKT